MLGQEKIESLEKSFQAKEGELKSKKGGRLLADLAGRASRKLKALYHFRYLRIGESGKAVPSLDELLRWNHEIFGELENLLPEECPEWRELNWADPLSVNTVIGEKKGGGGKKSTEGMDVRGNAGVEELSYAFFLFLLSFREALRGDGRPLGHAGGLLLDLLSVFSDFRDPQNSEAIRAALRSRIKEHIIKKREYLYRNSLARQYKESWDIFEESMNKWERTDLIFRTGYLMDRVTLLLRRHLEALSEEKLGVLTETVITSFMKSLSFSGESLQSRKEGAALRLIYQPGYERVLSSIKKGFLKKQIKVVYSPPFLTAWEREDIFHEQEQFFISLLDDELAERDLEAFQEACGDFQEELSKDVGFIDITSFPVFIKDMNREFLKDDQKHGEKPSVLPSREAMEQCIRLNRKKVDILKSYSPPNLTSFCYFPLPRPTNSAPGMKDVAPILDETISICCGEDWPGEEVQERLIEDLDRGLALNIRGRKGNETDLRVALTPLADGKRFTNFNNTGMGQNLPAGEVFTTPSLDGTRGLFHVSQFSFRGHTFNNLRLRFEEGFLVSCSCEGRYSREDDLLHSVLLGGHSSLPLGEVGLGTNTRAFKLLEDWDLHSAAPSLLVEKTAPHIALGDSCYARMLPPVYNPWSGKEIALLNNQPELYNRHIDIPLPFFEIGSFSLVLPDGEAEKIIEEGRFVPDYLTRLNRFLLPAANKGRRKGGLWRDE